MRNVALLLGTLIVTACAETASESKGTFVYNGQTYPSTTREFMRSDGSTYSRRSIAYGVRFVTCSATDDLDCIAAIRNSRRRDR